MADLGNTQVDDGTCERYKEKFPKITDNENPLEHRYYKCVNINSEDTFNIQMKSGESYELTPSKKCVTLYVGNDNRTICYNCNNLSCNLE